MQQYIKRSLLLFLFIIFSTISYAQQDNTHTLYKGIGAMQQTEKMPANQTARQYIELNKNIIQKGYLQKGEKLYIPTRGIRGDYQIERISNFTEDTYSVIAFSDDSTPQRILSFTIQNERIKGSIHVHNEQELYQLSWDQNNSSNYLATVDHQALDVRSCPADEALQVIGSQDFRRPDNQQHPNMANDSHAVIDLMVVYTNNAQNVMENNSNTNLFISEIVNRSQMALDASNIAIDLNLVHTLNTNYTEDPNNSSQTLKDLTGTFDGYMDSIHQVRDNYQADMVTLFADIDDVGGIAWILDSDTGAPGYAFSVNRVQQLEYTYTMIHELGHNMGSHHSRNQMNSAAPSGGGLNEYSTGWRWVGNDGQGYASVMTYEEGDQETPHFSNPDINYQGVKTGSYTGQYAPADNARSMNEMRATIAQYRTSPIPAAPQLDSPDNGKEAVTPAPELSWSESTKADEYYLQLATSADFNNPLLEKTVSSTNSRYQISDSLNHLTDYYWRVRAENENGASAFSTTFTFRTVIAPPEDVTITTPRNNDIQIPISPSLQWQKSERAEQYVVQISTEPDFSSNTVDAKSSSTAFTPSQKLEYATEYYWRVRAENEGGKSDFTDPIKFTTKVDQTEITMNYPNPFRNNTTIRYQLANKTDVKLEIYDTAGRKVKILVDEQQMPKVYNYPFSGNNLSSGVYIIRLLTKTESDILMMTMVK